MNSEKEFLIYGKRAVYEAIENDIEIDKVFLQKNNSYLDNIKSKIHKKNIQVSFVPIEKLNKLTKNNHQGIGATISPISTLFFIISAVKILSSEKFEKRLNFLNLP